MCLYIVDREGGKLHIKKHLNRYGLTLAVRIT